MPSALRGYSHLRAILFPELPIITTDREFGRLLQGHLKESLYPWLSPVRSTYFWYLHTQFMDTQPSPPACELVDWLRLAPPGSVSIVSGATQRRLIQYLTGEFGGVPPAIREIVGTEVPGSKAQKIRDVAVRVAGAPQHAVYVGDMQNDILAARTAGTRSVAVGYGYHSRSQMLVYGPETYVDTPDALTRLLTAFLGTD
jgi:phosphoglycolate phosphatase-like HAD superfamily hydrolase